MIIEYLANDPLVQLGAIASVTIITVVVLMNRATERSAQHAIQSRREDRMQIEHKSSTKG